MIDALRTGQATDGNRPGSAATLPRTPGVRRSKHVRLRDRPGIRSRRAPGFLGLVTWISAALGVGAAEIPVPNGSFESPSTNYVSVIIDDWVKPPAPDSYEGGGFLWEQLTGLFRNPIPTNPYYIDNMDGDQALWLFAVPEVSLFQELGTPGNPAGEDGLFEVGQSYELTAGVIGGGGGMREGVTLELALYYRDDASNQVTVASTSITHATSLFTNLTHFVDCQVEVPTVAAGDEWANRPIGIRFLSTVDTNLQGGYWDLDHVRLVTAGPPMLVDVELENGDVRFTLESEAGSHFDLLASADPGAPLDEWERVTTLTNLTGRATYSEPATNSGGRFYRARRLE